MDFLNYFGIVTSLDPLIQTNLKVNSLPDFEVFPRSAIVTFYIIEATEGMKDQILDHIHIKPSI